MTDWLTASGMLLSGLIVGFMIMYGMKRRDEKSDLERKDLEAKRDALIAQLRTEASAEERARLESEAADVLRRLDGLKPANVGPPTSAANVARPPSAATPSRSSAVVGFVWGAGSMIALAAIGYYVFKNATPKDTATQQPAAMVQPQQTDTAVKELEAAVQRNPGNLGVRDDLAKAYLDRENMNGVIEQTQYVLQRSPDDARALTYEALVRIAMRQSDAALQMLQRANKSDPNLLDAYVGLVWLHANSGRMDQAEAALAEAKRRHPEQAERLDALMQHIKPGGAQPQPVHVEISVGAGAQVPPGGVLFLIARAAGVTAGPPIAVKRLAASGFPINVDISSADSMNGQQLPPKVHIDVRLDADGDPMTKSDKDLRASQDGVALGQKVALTLK